MFTVKNPFFLLTIFFFLAFVNVEANSTVVLQDTVTTIKARVLNVIDQHDKTIPGTDIVSTFQTLEVEIIEGVQKGKVITISDDYLTLSKGNVFYLSHVIHAHDGREYYSVNDAYRMPTIYVYLIIFILLVLIVGGWQGLRGLISLALSLFIIIYVLLPGITQGYSPVMVSIVVSSLIIIIGSYITHGFNKTTTSAVIGMIITVIITGILAYFAVYFAKLSGFESDEAIYLNLDFRGKIDMVGILLGGMMIGLLGVLYDISIGQAIAIEELHHIAPHIDKKTIWTRGIRMGREHIGALVDTLAIAYVGASLPLLLLFSISTSSTSVILNKEIFSAEIIRILIGSIGLVLAVPITTLIAVYFLVKPRKTEDLNLIKEEKNKISHMHHHH